MKPQRSAVMRNGKISDLVAPFEPMDEIRRCQGRVLDILGLGPRESPSRVVLKKRAMTLRGYSDPQASGPVLLIIPAPIKRAYIWDLLPQISAVQEFVRKGVCVYLIQWERPDAQAQEFGLAEYADSLIGDCLHGIETEMGRGRPILAGHSLGGTFAAIFSALHPEKVWGLILLGAPLHFGPEVDALSRLAAQGPSPRILSAWLGRFSGSFLNMVSLAASPTTFAYARWADWMASLPDPEALQTHLLVERWTYDEMALPRRLFLEVVSWLYREDRFMRRKLNIGGRLAVPEQVKAPLLSVVEAQSAVVPPESVRPFYDAVGTTEKQWLLYHGDTGVSLQHVGMLMGKRAHEKLWPKIVRWTQKHGIG